MAKSQLERQVSEITTCSICLDDFNSPRALPCLHTFCLICLQRYCRDKRPGSKTKCPMCKAEFKIPKNGPDGFPVNFSMQTLIDAKLASSREARDRCEVCSKEQQFVPGMPTVFCRRSRKVFCEFCGQKPCRKYSLTHPKIPKQPHHVRPLAAEQEQATIGKNVQADIKGTHYITIITLINL